MAKKRRKSKIIIIKIGEISASDFKKLVEGNEKKWASKLKEFR